VVVAATPNVQFAGSGRQLPPTCWVPVPVEPKLPPQVTEVDPVSVYTKVYPATHDLHCTAEALVDQ